MPTYDYICAKCKKQIEVFQKITENALTKCPNCQEDTLTRKPGGGIGLAFTGDGFYSTMYGKKNTPPETSGGCCPCGKNKQACDKADPPKS